MLLLDKVFLDESEEGLVVEDRGELVVEVVVEVEVVDAGETAVSFFWPKPKRRASQEEEEPLAEEELEEEGDDDDSGGVVVVLGVVAVLAGAADVAVDRELVE